MTDRRVRLYLATVSVAALICVGWSILNGPIPPLLPLLLFAAMGCTAQSLGVGVSESGLASVALSIYVSGLLLFGPVLAATTAIAGAFNWADLGQRVPTYKLVFNAAQDIISLSLAAVVYQLLGGTYGGEWRWPILLVPALSAAITYHLANVLLVAGVISLTERVSLLTLLKETFLPYTGNHAAQVALALVMAWTYGTVGPTGIVLLIAPLLVARQTLQVYVHLKQAYEGTIRSLVAAIEAKDAYTRGHSERVADYAEAIARQLDMSEDAIDKLRIAALLHDLGKLGIQRRILSKTGRLTEDEFGLMQEHPELATAILRDVSFLEDIIPAIYHHHEHYDGSGYVRNLKGEQIPLTARILAVADAYDAMISARPYRDALTPEMAAAELVSCSGSQFDRKAVDALLAATGVQPQLTEEIGVAKGQLRFVDETT